MSKFCGENPQGKIAGGRNGSYGFKIKTDRNIYYLRCNPAPHDYNLYCFAYERIRLEKCFPSLIAANKAAKTISDTKPTLKERLEDGKRKADGQYRPEADGQYRPDNRSTATAR